jgi:peroxiredoxin
MMLAHGEIRAMGLRWRFGSIGLCVVLVAPCAWQQAAWGRAATEAVPAAAQKAFDDAAQYEQRKQLSSAQDSLHTALKAAGGHCVPCLDALARVQLKMELFKDSAATAEELASQSSDAAAKAHAETRAGMAFYQLYFAQSEGRGAIDKSPKHAADALKQAEEALQRAETADPADESARMLHGRILAAQKRDEDASKEFAACAATPGVSAQECARALHFAKDVSIARDEPAPAFTLKTIDGKTVTLDSLAGKVVLVDFWATWCSVCARDSDYVQSMVDSFDGKPFVLLEVSADESVATWENFVKDKRLEGVQTHDDKHEVADMFHVGGYPTYVILDGDGTVRLRAVGIEGDLKGTVRKLLEAQAAAPAPERKLLQKSGGQ